MVCNAKISFILKEKEGGRVRECGTRSKKQKQKKEGETLLKLHLLRRFQKRCYCFELQWRFLKNVAKLSLFSGIFQKRHSIPLIATNLKTSLKKTPPKPRFLVVWSRENGTNKFDSKARGMVFKILSIDSISFWCRHGLNTKSLI